MYGCVNKGWLLLAQEATIAAPDAIAEFFKNERLEFFILVLTNFPLTDQNFKLTLLEDLNQNNTLKKM